MLVRVLVLGLGFRGQGVGLKCPFQTNELTALLVVLEPLPPPPPPI